MGDPHLLLELRTDTDHLIEYIQDVIDNKIKITTVFLKRIGMEGYKLSDHVKPFSFKETLEVKRKGREVELKYFGTRISTYEELEDEFYLTTIRTAPHPKKVKKIRICLVL